MDYRALNAITKRNIQPLPRIDDLLDRVQGVSHFSSLDLAQGYYQMGIAKEDKENIAFKTVYGLFEFNTITMGLINAPSVFHVMTVFPLCLFLIFYCVADRRLFFSPPVYNF